MAGVEDPEVQDITLELSEKFVNLSGFSEGEGTVSVLRSRRTKEEEGQFSVV